MTEQIENQNQQAPQAPAVSVFKTREGWKWKFFSRGLGRDVQSVRAYTLRQSALRAGQRAHRRAYGLSIDELRKGTA